MYKLIAALALTLQFVSGADEAGFKPLFDGKTLNGWKLVGGHGPGYVVQDGKIVYAKDEDAKNAGVVRVKEKSSN